MAWSRQKGYAVRNPDITSRVQITSGCENWTRENIAWLAGLMEGEACFVLCFKQNQNGTRYPWFSVSVNMTDGDVVDKAARITGMGNYSGPWPQKNPKHKPFYRWNVTKREYVYALLVALYPFMGLRRKAKIESILEAFVQYGQRRWRHGTRQGYEFHGCRCAKCRTSNTIRHRKRRQAIPRNLLFYTANGQTLSSTEWEKITGIHRTTMRTRRLRGWSDDRIINTPSQSKQAIPTEENT